MDKPIAITILLVGVALLLIGGLVEATRQGGILNGDSGQQVSCNVQVNAALSGKLEVTGATCNRVDSCMHSPLKSLTIGDVKGNLQLLQSGNVYDDTAVVKNRLASASSFTLAGCVPADASQVRIQVLNEQGGVDDDRAVNIQ